MENAGDAERYSKEKTAGEGSSLEEFLEQWRTATANIRAILAPASHLAKVNSRRLVRAHGNSHRELIVLALLHAETFQHTSLPQYSIVFKRLRAFGPRSSVGAVHERHMQLEGTRVGDEALVTEDLVYLAEQRLGLEGANP